MQPSTNAHADASFTEQLAAYRQAIDADIAAYVSHAAKTTRAQYGKYAADVVDVFFDMLSRGGKRVRGSLVMAGYEMCGGQDRQMIVRAATAVEMLGTYILMIDDIQDRSQLRRGKPSAHKMLADYHRKHKLKDDAAHGGVSLALNAALSGAHAAQMLLAGLQVDAGLRIKAIGIANLAYLVTAHGQTQDIMNELAGQATPADIDNVLEWKTATYTVLNPLCIGMVLAGAGCEDTDAIRDYALHTGKAFQITDDIIGTFGDQQQTGKSTMDDIREGKITILTAHALDNLAPQNADFLRSCLGNSKLTADQFARCQQLIKDSGALGYAQQAASQHIAQALNSLDVHVHRWPAGQVSFLRQFTQSLQARTS